MKFKPQPNPAGDAAVAGYGPWIIGGIGSFQCVGYLRNEYLLTESEVEARYEHLMFSGQCTQDSRIVEFYAIDDDKRYAIKGTMQRVINAERITHKRKAKSRQGED